MNKTHNQKAKNPQDIQEEVLELLEQAIHSMEKLERLEKTIEANTITTAHDIKSATSRLEQAIKSEPVETLEQAIKSITMLEVQQNNLLPTEIHNLEEYESNSCCHCSIS